MAKFESNDISLMSECGITCWDTLFGGGIGSSVIALGLVTLGNIRREFDPLAAIPSNVEAIETAMSFGTGHERLVLIVGPTGWGKTRILEASAKTAKEVQKTNARVIDAATWAHSVHALDPDQPLWLDNVHDAMSKARTRVPLQLALARRAQAKRPTMLAASCNGNREIAQLVPNYRDWNVVRIKVPSKPERQLVVTHLAQRMGVELSDSLSSIISHRLGGSARAIEGALRRLQLAGPTWTSDIEAIRACGILTPLFDDNGQWDMRTTMSESAHKFLESAEEPNLDERSLAIFGMRHWAHIPEADVAHFFEATGGQIYGSVRRYRERIRNGQIHRDSMDRFATYVVDRMSRDR
jgi:energy-coupling factor transporter ATP-binding protein EcfA2